jgi:hypothetical protein
MKDQDHTAEGFENSSIPLRMKFSRTTRRDSYGCSSGLTRYPKIGELPIIPINALPKSQGSTY